MSEASRPEANPPRGEGPGRAVWVFGDTRSLSQTRATRALLGRARYLADRLEGALWLILVGEELEPRLELFRSSGVDRALLMEHPRLSAYSQETFAAALAHLVLEHRPEIFLFLANDCGRELAPRLAARLDTGLCADCIGLDIDPQSGLLVQTVPAFGDQIYANIVTPVKRPQMATVRFGAGTLLATPAQGAAAGNENERCRPEILRAPFPAGIRPERVRRLGAEKDAGSGEALEKARVVVCGGRGVGSGARFRSLRDLADLLGAEVAGTRPAVHAHWIDEDRMIGQTGRSVAPEVLLLFGISGAVQFTAAIEQARYVIAVNRDPEAAVFKAADLGIVGDARQIVPELIRRSQRLLVEQYGRSPEEVNPRARASSRVSLGAMLQDLREEREYGLEEASEALEMSPQELEKIERGELPPSVSFLLRAARLFRVDPARFLSRADEIRADRRRAESFMKRAQNYSYRTLTPGAEEKHLRAFLITIDPRQDHKMIEYRHEGEEFVYVMRGEVEIKVGEELHGLRKGESLHFDASIPHHLRNQSQQKTELIVVLYTP
ncbi:MAG: FAD-binding protein [bacterium]